MKVAVITCYKRPDEDRARTLRAGFGADDSVELTVIKNKSIGLKRYFEVIWQLIKVRFSVNPDVYVLTFRAYEMLPFLVFIAAFKPIIYDEYINPLEWAAYEHHKIPPNGVAASIFMPLYRLLLRRVKFILADTKAHADNSARINKVSLEKYRVIPVSTDEQIFRPLKHPAHKNFRVFYYSSLLPLHGIEYVLEAAKLLKSNKQIEFTIVVGNPNKLPEIQRAIDTGAHIKYLGWINLTDLPKYIKNSDLGLGGPFGNTVQAQLVITGKTYHFLASAHSVLIGKTQVSKVFTDEQNALIVPQGNAKAIADKIEWAFKHRSSLAEIGKSGRQTYDQYFSNAVVARLARSLLDELSSN